ncbi:MAG: cytochrome b [Cohaesibacter sp.]|nr:cytochrome b [Cohaesibacter sp.]
MALRNTTTGYGSLARFLHWGMALLFFGMFGLGWWMVDLTYYSPYYKTAPNLHISIGMVVALLLLLRFGWKVMNIEPDSSYLPAHERLISHLVHFALYGLLAALIISGYLIFTADGRALEIFGLFTLPSLIQVQGMEDIAGFIHEYLAYGAMALVGLHALAALKHHFIDKDPTLRRMTHGHD